VYLGPSKGRWEVTMIRSRAVVILALAFLAALGISVQADVRADEKTHLQLGGMLGHMMNAFGGHGAKDGITSSVAVQGDRKATFHEGTGQIIDLGEEKVYDLDLKKKTFKITTFAELRRRLEEAQNRAHESGQHQAKTAPARDPNAKEMEVDVDIRNTGLKKTVNGYDTHQTIMTITLREKGRKLEDGGGMVVTSDMWLAPPIAAMKEIGEFDRRYAAKLAGPAIAGASADQMAAAMAMYPMMKQAMSRLATEGGRVEGTPILTTVTIDAVKSAEQVAQEAKQADADHKSGDPVSGLLVGLAKRGQKPEGDDKGRATVMSTTTEVLKVASTVDASDLAVPAGFKENK